MPAQIPLEARYYPNDFQVETFNLGTVAGPNNLLFYFDREVVIDSAILTLPDNPTNASVNFKLVKVANANVPNYASPVTGQTDVSTVRNYVTGGTYPAQNALGFVAESSADARGNVIAAGSYLWLCSDAAVTGVTGPASLMLRWRSQR